MTSVLVQHEGAVAVIRLDAPARRNVLDAAMCAGISTAIEEVQADATVKSVVITGAAPAFCAGADIAVLRNAADGDTATLDAVYRAFLDVAECALPTIAAVNGAAVGAGINLALACDCRLAATGTVFDTRFLQIGLHPGGGHTWMLLRAVGWAEAARLLLLASPATAEEALRIGLVQMLSAPEDVVADAIALGQRSAALPRELLVATKAAMRMAANGTHAASVEHETAAQLTSLSQPAFRELVARLNIGARP